MPRPKSTPRDGKAKDAKDGKKMADVKDDEKKYQVSL